MKWLAVLTTIFFIFAILAFFSAVYFESKYQDTIYPGILVGNIEIGGKTQKEALTILNEKKDALFETGLTFIHEDKTFILPAEILSSDPDLAKTIISVDTNKAVKDAYATGRKGNWMENVFAKTKILMRKKNIDLSVTLNEEEIQNILRNELKHLENPERDAQFIFEGDAITVLEEREGNIFDYKKTIEDVRDRIRLLDSTPITTRLTKSLPKIKAGEVQKFVPYVRLLLSTTTPALTYENKTWEITEKQFKEWLEVAHRGSSTALQFKKEGVRILLDDTAEAVNREPADAKFELVNNRVTQFQISRNGKKLNMEKSYEKINYEYFQNKNRSIELVVDIIPPNTATDDVNNLGIKELLGTGISNFSGSPKNRRLNIANGAKLLNGLLIKPGEEFSLLKALAPFNDANGYLKELVIKGDRTIPEYGGGLCQIGTTTFRATMRSGLKITERRNHSYRVRYYEPAGIDATIYEPSPDFRFINDTPGHILIITEIDGDNLVFKFYGTSDGRVAEVPEKAKIYNVTSPGEPRFIETEELPPGERVLVEKPHAGADTEFDYVVQYSDGTVHKETFKSRYVPWRETWLVGKDPNAPSATSTPSVTAEQGAANSFN